MAATRVIQSLTFKTILKRYNFCVKPYLTQSSLTLHTTSTILFPFNKSRYKNQPDVLNIFLEVIGNGTNGMPKCLRVVSNGKVYLFNSGEGVQRNLDNLNFDLWKINRIFITYKNWNNLGGLPGLILSLENKFRSINLYGPPRIENLLTGLSSFKHGIHMKIDKHEYFDEPFNDGGLSFTSIPIFNSINEKRIFNRSKPNNSSNTSKVPLELLDPRDVSIAYICKSCSVPGLLLLDKCVELDIPLQLVRELKNGEPVVTLPDGRLVKSTDVFTPVQPPTVFIIIDCPTEEFLDSLLQNEELKNCQVSDKSNSTDIPAELVVHFTPNDVLHNPKYKKWISRFPSTTQHLILNESCPSLVDSEANRLQHKLNLIHSDVFPLLKTYIPEKTIEGSNIILAEPLLRYSVFPKTGFDKSKITQLDTESCINDVTRIPEWKEKYHKFEKNVKNNSNSNNSDSDLKYPQVTFLGTSSAVSTSTRNVSCILLRLNESKYMILDCGEGSYGQILRFFGTTETANILKNLSAIFISHLHADHHLGLMQILDEREKLMKNDRNFIEQPLVLLAPRHMGRWLSIYNNTMTPIMHQINLIPNGDLYQRQSWPRRFRKMFDHLDLKEISTVKVRHVALTYGVIITFKNGRKIVFSGDTMPCNNLVEAGKNCDLLIHEATLDDSLIDEARSKTHSTTSQAIEIGRRMKAKFIMLTHFSQRYAIVPIFTDEFHNNVGVAVDNMTVSLNNVGLTSLFRPILEEIFKDEIENNLNNMQEKLIALERDEERKKRLNTKEKTVIDQLITLIK